MSLRYFEGEDHAKVYAQFRPTPPDSLIKRMISFLRDKYDGPLNQAVDLGCGTGQCTLTLAKDFQSVLGTDISEAQVAQGNESLAGNSQWSNVKFEASPAEKIPLPDNSVQLITICEAAHWMDLPKVMDEAKRALVKNGVFAVIGYSLPKYTPVVVNDKEKAGAINKAVDKAIGATLDYWPPQAMMVMREYSDLVEPVSNAFSDFTREGDFLNTRTTKMPDITGAIRTYSPFQLLVKEKGEKFGDDLLETLEKEITSVLNEGRENPLSPEEIGDYEFISSIQYFVLMGRA